MFKLMMWVFFVSPSTRLLYLFPAYCILMPEGGEAIKEAKVLHNPAWVNKLVYLRGLPRISKLTLGDINNSKGF